jgi:drug/metabolite transporter (DMT)-like permease
LPTESRRKAYLVLLAALACIAWSALFVRWANVPGPVSAFYRVFFAATILVPWRLIRGGAWPSGRPLRWIVLGGLFFAADLSLYNMSILMSSATTATLLGNSAPVVVGLGGWLLFGRRPSGAFWVGLALAVSGSALIIGSDAMRNATHGLGDVFGLIAAVFYAGYLLSTGEVRKSIDTLTFTTVSVTSTTLALLVVCLVFGLPLTGYSTKSWMALAGLGFFTQLGGYLAISYSLGHLPATFTSVALLAQAPLTALLAGPLLGERLTEAQIIGSLAVLAGIWVVSRDRQT